MDILNGLMLGLESALTPALLFYCFVGVFIGTLTGVIPGIGALSAISLLLPFTFSMTPEAAIIMLAGVYYGAQYGSSTAAILLNLPGTPMSAVTCLDGYPMAKAGRAGVALFMTTIASFVGSMLGIAALAFFSPSIAVLGLKFGASEYFAMILLGLVAASSLATGSTLKGLAMVVFGLLLSTIGTDINSGVTRFDFGVTKLMDGINLVALAMGIFGIQEIINSINQKKSPLENKRISFHSMQPEREDIKRSILPMLRGTGIGSFFGALPGTGATIASFVSYAVEKKVSKHPERFGKGAVEGICAPEAANNAAAQTGFVPTLSLGIPGDPVMALILGALILHGIQPGPLLISDQPVLFWGLIVSFALGNIMLLVLNIPLIGLWVAILRIPYRILYPAIVIFICLGVFSVKNSTFDIFAVAIIGALGYAMSLFRFQAAPMILGFVLGPMLEENFRRAMLLGRGDLNTFIDRPISATLMALIATILLWSLFKGLRRSLKEQRN